MYAKINVNSEEKKKGDLVGMFLKEIEKNNEKLFFSDFVNLNSTCNIEYIISIRDLKERGSFFGKGDFLYNPDIFKKIKREFLYCKKGMRKGTRVFRNKDKCLSLNLKGDKKINNEKVSKFKFYGEFKILK